MDNPLRGHTILVTRPRHQAQPLCELIRINGGAVRLFPTITINPPHDQKKFTQIVNRIGSFHIAIFVSQNSVHAALPLWPKPTPPSLTMIAIGPGTQAALLKNNLPVNDLPIHYSSEGLLALPVLQAVINKSIVILSGENTRPFLQQELERRGASVTLAMGYQRECPHVNDTELQPLLSSSFDVIVSTSQASLQNLTTLFTAWPHWLYQQQLLVINDVMAKQAHALGFTKTPLIASNASDNAIIDTLKMNIN